VRLVANREYWDTGRGPHLREVVFRNDLSPERALELICTTEGEVDILTELSPEDAERVERSEHAKLVSIDAIRAVVGIINRDADGLPLGDARARQALNLAVDRDGLVLEAMSGRAEPLAGLTPPSAVTILHRVSPYPHDADRAAELWREAGGAESRPLRLAAPDKFKRLVWEVAEDLRGALGVETEVTVYRGDEERQARRRLAERDLPREWDILIWEQAAQAADGPPLELHRAFVGETGEYRAGPVVPEFEALYAELVRETDRLKQTRISYRIDKLVHDEALALFLCAPQALYAVNKHVDFTAYRTTFELPECKVSGEHWSRR
jgi:ABC-type transport system substrate-binding protein